MERCEISGDIPGEFTFVTEDGVQRMSYKDYCNNDHLLGVLSDKTRIRIQLGRIIYAVPRKVLRFDANMRRMVDDIMASYEENRFRFFLPSGRSAVEFLNEEDSSIDLLYGPNRSGKTTHALIKALCRAIPTQPEWEIFKAHGVRWREWSGPQDIGIATYQSAHLRNVIWPQLIKKWVPKHELGEFNDKSPNWNQSTPVIPLTCGTKIYLFTYEQKQEVYESQALSGFVWDEQGEEQKFDGANERCRTTDGWHIFSLTPHYIEGRPDTGSAGWINKLWKGEMTKGHTVSRHMLSLRDVADWVYPERQKLAAYRQWVTEPMQRGDIRAMREGRARLFGEPQESSGLLFDDWNRHYNLIDPFDIPKTWPRFRSLDHGNRGPTSCIYWTVTPEGIRVIYRVYKRPNLTPSEHSRNIVEEAGNRLRYIGSEETAPGVFIREYEEVMRAEHFVQSKMDSRCFAKKSHAGIDIGQLYRKCGLRVEPASGLDFLKSRGFIDELLRVDMKKEHPWLKEKGCPGVVVFRTCSDFISEIEGYVAEPQGHGGNGQPKDLLPKRGVEDHVMDAFRYGAQMEMRYEPLDLVDDFQDNHDQVNKTVRLRDTYTGY
jgi:hypothetical protein